MSHHISVSDLPPEGEKLQLTKFTSWRSILLLCAIAGVAASLLLFLRGGEAADAFAFSYLFALEVFFTITAGATFWVLLHNASNSSWGVAIRRIPELMTQLFVPLLILALPLFMPFLPTKPSWMGHLWEWIGIHAQIMEHPPLGTSTLKEGLGATHDTALLYKKFPYLHNGIGGLIPGMDIRMILFFGALFFIGSKLLNYSLSQDRTGDVQPTYSARRFSCGMLPIFAVCSTFAAIDWVMSMNYLWFSTMFGVNIFAGSALASMALIILIVGTLVKTGHFKHIVTEEHFHLMGKLMHAFIIFWAYIAFSQYFLIWYANITEETRFYLTRNTEGWRDVSIFIVVGHFIAPFVLLLSQPRKKKPAVISGICLWILFMHVVDIYWNVIPERGPSLGEGVVVPGAWVGDIVALCTFVGLLGFIFLRSLARYSLYPCRDPRLLESANVVN